MLASHAHQLDAVFVADDLRTLGPLAPIHAVGLQIRGDVSVVGFGDVPWAASLNPPLMIFAEPQVDMGETACRLLRERLGGQCSARSRHVLLQPKLVVRSATHPATRLASPGKEGR